MTTLYEMVAVMQAAERGEKIEFKSLINDSWRVIEKPMWNWGNGDYRIAKPVPKMRKVKLLAWFNGSMLFWDATNNQYPNCKRVPSEDKEIEVEE